jgi:hypothetical protein
MEMMEHLRQVRLNRAAAPFILFFLLAIIPAHAQKPEASLRVRVADPNGAAIPNARVTLGKQQQSANARGEAQFNPTPSGKQSLQIMAAGFAPLTIKGFPIKPGANQIEVRLEIATVQDEVTVGRDKREANTDPRGDAFTTVLTAEQLAQLPDDPEEFEQAIRNMAGPGATFRVNGYRGGRLPPKNQIREIRFRTNAYAAESHEASFISVDVYTKPGLDNWHGSFNFGFRDESLNARNAFARFRAPEQNRRFGVEFGGPLWKQHTSLFMSADGVNSFEAKTIVAALPGEAWFDQIRQPWRTLNFAARVEHLLTPKHTTRFEYQRNATRRDNNGVGNFDFPERGFTTDTAEHLFRFAESGSVGKKLFHEIRFQARWQDVRLDSLSNAQTIQVLNAFTRGGAQVTSDRREREFEVADNLDVALKRHTIRFGFQLEAANDRSDEQRNQNGTFVFSSLDAFRAGRPTTFTQRSGAGRVGFNQVQLGWYAQDDWRALKSLTLSFGLRHEWQNTLGDNDNFMPRLGFAWSPTKKGATTIRGGAGVFYDWFSSENYEQALRVNGQQQSDRVIRDPGFPNPESGGTAVILPASRIRLDPMLRMPKLVRASIGLEQQLPGNARLMAQYAFTRGLHTTRGRNINAPINGVRPDPAAGNITQIESSANSFNHMLMLNGNVFKMGRYTLSGSYVWAKTTNEADSPLALPADNFNLRAERGPAATDIRHRVFLLSTYTLPRGFRLSSILQASSAVPYNLTTGFDDNGDTIVNDRPRGVGRNSARGAGMWDASTRFAWGFSFGRKPEAAGGGAPQVRVIRGDSDAGGLLGSIGSLPNMNDKRFRTEFFVQATNLFNTVNPIGFSGVQTSPFFGQATAAMPGRRLETGMRFSF